MRAPRAAVVGPTLVLTLLVALGTVRGDPSVLPGSPGSLDLVWDFQNPANYTLAGLEVQGHRLALAPTGGWWNSSQAVDFANPAAAYNVDLASYPGRVLLNDTSQALNATYISRVWNTSAPVAWGSAAWAVGSVERSSDDFNGTALDPRWSWYNPPLSYSVGSPRTGYLRFASRTNTDFYGTRHSGQFLYQNITGDFDVATHLEANLTQTFQKVGIVVMIDANNWASVHRYLNAGVKVRSITTVAGASTQDGQASVDAPYLRVRRQGNSLQAYYGLDGTNWTLLSSPGPGTLPASLWVGIMAADGLSGTPVTLDADYVHFTFPPPTVQVEVRGGNSTTPGDASWSPWSSPLANATGTPLALRCSNAQFRFLLFTPSLHLRPWAGNLHMAWASHVPRGEAFTESFAVGGYTRWTLLVTTADPGTGEVAVAYWTAPNWSTVAPGPVGATLEGDLRLRFTLSSPDAVDGPTLSAVHLVLQTPPPAGPPWGLYAAVALGLGLAPIPPLLILRRARVQDIFVILRDGILLAHASRGDTLRRDEDNLAGALTVIQDFVSQSFTYGGGARLKRLDMGRYKVALERGKLAYMAAIYSGPSRFLISLRMRRFLRALEARYGGVLQPWRGDMEAVRDLPRELEVFLAHRDRGAAGRRP